VSHSLQTNCRESDPPRLLTYLEFLSISKEVHFRPFFYNVKISICVSCGFEHGVLQLNIFKPEICLWDGSLFSVT